MRNILKLALIVLLVTGATNIFAQKNFKFGHVDSNALMQIMPERQQAQQDLETFATELEKQLEVMQVEFQNKYQDYLAKTDSLSDLIRQSKESELQDLQLRIQKFQESAQQELSKKEAELIQPIIDKARAAIEEVGKENGYTYIFDLGTGPIIYFSQDSDDILPLVKKKLGLE
jgi:outer membrane protein